MQVYDRGLKRRLPPMVDGDPRRIRMVYSLLFSLPGTPTLYYGEEIGMGEDLDAPGRMAVRSPDAVVAGTDGRLLDRRAGTADPAVHSGWLRARPRQRPRPAARPRLAVDLHAATHPDLPRVSRARLGRVRRARSSPTAGCSSTPAPGAAARSSPLTTSPPNRWWPRSRHQHPPDSPWCSRTCTPATTRSSPGAGWLASSWTPTDTGGGVSAPPPSWSSWRSSAG